ncbi:hypothetical protein BJX64DRAFT_289599 [Aspergillus heterothallicus]
MKAKVGNRLLPAVVDEVAQSTPERIFGVIPSGSTAKDGFRNVTFRDLAEVVNAMAWWIEDNISRTPETVAYMGANDIRYYIFIIACAKTGHTPFLPSTRLSDEAYQHILDATNCSKMVFTDETRNRTMDIKALRPGTDFVEGPSLANLLARDVENYPFSKEYTNLEDDVAIIIHSSGTTGMPKPVPLTHGFIGVWDHNAHIFPEGRKSAFYNDMRPGDRVLSTTPNFHLMGLLAMFESILHGTPAVSVPDGPLSVQSLVETIQATRPTLSMLPPSIIEEISTSEAALEAVGIVRYVGIAGAPLSTETGEVVRKYTNIRAIIGSSEIGMVSSLAPESEDDWQYFEWNPAYGVEMRDVGDERYEAVIVRRKGATAKQLQGIFHTFPEMEEYHTKDLFVRHPTKAKLWAYSGRLDDIIVLSNGEKLNPVTLEKTVEGHPLVARAVLVGEKRFQTALLIEPKWSEEALNEEEYIDAVWPTIQRANETVPKYGRVMRSHVSLASRSKQFVLTPKGSTQRRAVNNDYAEEIDAIYHREAYSQVADLPSTMDLPNIMQWLQSKAARLLERPAIDVAQDFYAAGLDSLQTVNLAKSLSAALEAPITQQHIYANPTVSQLSSVLMNVLHKAEMATLSRTEVIAKLISRYTDDLPPETHPICPATRELTVILTGSTGSLGTYLLHALLNNPTISKVYCLNRSLDAKVKQEASLSEKGLETTLLCDRSKVEFLQASFGEGNFGLDIETYNTLLKSVTLVIHNAWTVNFNHPVGSFESPHIKGVRNFINFSLASRYRAHIAFVSSVSTICAWNPKTMGTTIPEEAMETPDVVLRQGYGESKHIGERICHEASRRSGVPTSILRVGQIAGPTTKEGLWNPNEWVPILLKTSKAMGAVPEDLGAYAVDWIPVDMLARITLDVLQARLDEIQSNRHSSSKTDAAFFHLTNPRRTTWATLLPSIQLSLGVTPIPLTSWVAKLEELQHPSAQDIQDRPALKLLPFFRGLACGESMAAEISVERATAASPSMQSLEAISGDLMENWIGQWGF